MKKRKEQGQRTLDKKTLPIWLTLFVAAALIVAAGLFCFMRYVIFKNAPDALSDVVASTSTLLGVFTIGGAALIQLRKHIIFEEQSKLDRDGKMSDRLTRAIENLHNKESLAVREGALFELKRLGLDFPREQENIVTILGPFIREGIEDTPRKEDGLARPSDDVFIACEIVSLFNEKTGCCVDLERLQAEKINLGRMQLQGAMLLDANFQDASLICAKLQGAILFWAYLQRATLDSANFQGAKLLGAHLQGAKGLTAKQLLDAEFVEEARLDDDLCAAYNRLKSERDAITRKEVT